ncbi:1-deoxy-D-xylulose 5-phosphate reductoisomerase [BD1-7 clade bacterium]|uniref:1-deoxy-D-xylulose 5-phosphate reductoisomerase n=1 Tax=BD1-7 clade bacterium TaxID=2029982 RepID=A0A5S9PVD4_9GAMM|nr:1-deoxy-D-xylulose 5-phosphate reductoisomerase [BD1-7 clade bacterium]
MQQVTVLGATGSIGVSTLDVIRRHPDKYSVFAVTANSRVDELYQQCVEFQPVYAVVASASQAQALQSRCVQQGLQTEVLNGEEGLCQAAKAPEVDVVMAAIVGAAGLEPTLAAVSAGKKVLLANKESLVMAGALFIDCVRRAGATLLPIDSEHNAMFQCLPVTHGNGLSNVGVRKLLLTGSGGPFRTLPLDQFDAVTPEQACAHPNWSMGQKISVDSATMMNKGLELIEACWLFDTTPEQIDVVIHKQSIIHSLVQYSDGTTLAQMGNPDMRTPIAYGLAWPERITAGVDDLDLVQIAQLDFEAPDEHRFPCLRLAREAFIAGGTAPAILNAANEIAVEAFLHRRASFSDIARINETVLNKLEVWEPKDLGVVQKADALARQTALSLL